MTSRPLKFSRSRLLAVPGAGEERVYEPVIQKEWIERDGRCFARVTFTLPNCIWADTVYLVGDFNQWDCRAHPFQRDEEGQWTVQVELECHRVYQFRYLCDGNTWINDYQADAYVPNPHGSDNFVVVTDPDFHPYLED